ncbi:MAG: EAL domain-containing protein [Clostridia bacterium]|nr:EAL domain-containing protein [Clostridia bacterium]
MFKGIATQDVLEAIRNHEIQVYYQPQYDALTNKMKGAEALARWVKPDGTVLLPGAFIPQLEASEHICTLDWYMLHEACAFLRDQPDNKRHRISVNFSRRHFYEPHFIDTLCATVDSYGIARKWIGVEITESAAVQLGPNVVRWVREVQKAGFRVAMDDFGSGMSSLIFLKDIPVDVLKLDRSLLSTNCESERERAMLESILAFAHRLNMTTIAEGVETEEQLSFLRTSGCQRIQGFLMSRPMPAEEYRRHCDELKPESEDVLSNQTTSSAMNLLIEAVFKRFPLVIFANITRNSYYMMAYENFTTRTVTGAGVFDELIRGGTATMHPEDRAAFSTAFTRENLLAAHARGEKSVRVVTRQMGDDGVYRQVETVDYFVTNPSTDDVLIIAMSQNLE